MPPENEGLDEVPKMASVLLRDGNLSSSNMADQMTAEDAKSSHKESQQEIPSRAHGHLTLETLPNEIISSIAEMLAISIDEPYVVSRPGLTTSDNRKREDARARRDLTSLCMVSKRMASNAQKALYRNVLITHANTLILLYRTFLENSKLGIHVKRMSLNVDHGQKPERHLDPTWGNGPSGFYNGDTVDLSPLLSCAQHGLGEGFAEAVESSQLAPTKIPIEIFFTLQFRVLCHTSNLDSLDVHVRPFLLLIRTYTKQRMQDRHWEEVNTVLCSLWDEIMPCLPRVKKLQIFGNHEPIDARGFLTAHQLFRVHICRFFLQLPSLEKIVWINCSRQWFSTLPFLMVSGIDTGSRFESVRVLKVQQSPCLPQGLDIICSAFPNLESLSVDNGYRHESFEPTIECSVNANKDSNPSANGRYLTDNLTGLKNLKKLNLDLHYYHEISGTLGPSGTLNLAGLPNLETLEMPLQFFARIVLPDGYHQLVSPEGILPRGLSALRILACYECHSMFRCDTHLNLSNKSCRYWRPPLNHGDAVVELLDSLAVVHDEYLPRLKHICYEEVDLDEAVYSACPDGPHVDHLKSGCADAESLSAAVELLRQKGVTFVNRSKLFHCSAA